jgi:hypothetical protein
MILNHHSLQNLHHALPGLSEGFVVSTSLMVDSLVWGRARATLILIQSEETGAAVTLFVAGGQVFLEIGNDQGSSSLSLLPRVPPGEWLHLQLGVTPRGADLVNVHFSVNRQLPTVIAVRSPGFGGDQVAVQTGGFLGDDKPELVCAWLGAHSLALADGEGCPCGPSCIEEGPFVRSEAIAGFRDVFVDNRMGGCLVPFFGRVADAPSFFIEKIIGVLKYSFRPAWFAIIGQDLLAAPARCKTYALYLRFFQLFTEIGSRELFLHVVFNFRLWSGAAPAAARRILTHWGGVLFSPALEFGKFIRFRQVLELGRRYFPQDVEQLMRVLAAFSVHGLDADDTVHLIRVISNVEEREQLCLLRMLEEVAECVPNKQETCERLHCVFRTPSVEVFVAALRADLRIAGPERVAKEIQQLLCYVQDVHMSRGFLALVRELCQEWPELLPLVCMIASNLGPEERRAAAQLMSSLVETGQRQRAAAVPGHFAWPALLLIRSKGPIRDQVVNGLYALLRLGDEKVTGMDDLLAFLALAGLHMDAHWAQQFVLKKMIEDARQRYRTHIEPGKKPSRAVTKRYLDEMSVIITFAWIFLILQPASSPHSADLIQSFESSPWAKVHAAPVIVDSVTVTGILTQGTLQRILGATDLMLRVTPAVCSDVEALKLFQELGKMRPEFQSAGDALTSFQTALFQFLEVREHLSRAELIDLDQAMHVEGERVMWNAHGFLKTVCQVFRQSLARDLECAAAAPEEKAEVSELARFERRQRQEYERAFLKYRSRYLTPHSMWHADLPDLPGAGVRASADSFIPRYPTLQRRRREVPGRDSFECELADSRGMTRTVMVEGGEKGTIWLGDIRVTPETTRGIAQRGSVGIEFLLNDGRSFVLRCGRKHEQLQAALNFYEHAEVTQAQLKREMRHWKQGVTSNFDYLMRLNFFAGRLGQDGPVFPFPSDRPSPFSVPRAIDMGAWQTAVHTRRVGATYEVGPEWFESSVFTNAHSHLLVLESDDAREALPAWIDRVIKLGELRDLNVKHPPWKGLRPGDLSSCVLEADESWLRGLRVFPEARSAFATSRRFGLTVVGTESGGIQVYDGRGFLVRSSASLGARVEFVSVLLTEPWVIAVAGGRVVVLDEKLRVVGERVLPFSPCSLRVAAPSGLDLALFGVAGGVTWTLDPWKLDAGFGEVR